MAKRPSTALILLAEGLHRLDTDVTEVLRRHGVDPRRIDPSALIDEELELRANIAVAQALRNPLAGLEAGAGLGLGTYGAFTLLLLTSADLLASVHTAIRFQRLSFLFGRIAFEPGRHQSALVLQPAALPPPAYRFRTDLEVAGTWKLMRDISHAAQAAGAATLAGIAMPYERPAEADAYARTFGCPVSWGAGSARFLWHNATLHAPFATADPNMHAVLRAQCEQRIVELEAHPGDVRSRVAAHLAAHLGSRPGATDTAAALGISERSLRRALRAEGTNFRSQRDAARLAKAQELLRSARLPVEAIAQRLGYSEPAAFIHAFKRWTGVSPAAFRRASTREPPGGG